MSVPLVRARDTFEGRTRIAAEHARLTADQVLQAAELILQIGAFGELDGELPPATRAAIDCLQESQRFVRQAREALRGPKAAKAGAPAT